MLARAPGALEALDQPGHSRTFNDRGFAMSIRNSQILGAVALVLVLAAVYVAKFGLYPRYFDIEWDEEVQLHDGRVIVVHVKRTFERLNTLDRQRGVHRDTEISFDAGGTIGRFQKTFQRYDVTLLENKGDQWFIGLVKTTGTPPIQWVDFSYPFLVLQSDGQLRRDVLANFPKEFTRYNVMPLTPDAEGIARFDGQVLTTKEKMAHWSRYPRGAGDDGFIRPRNASNQGENK